MHWIYLLEGAIFLVGGLVFVLRPGLIRRMMEIILAKDLFLIPGLIEIGLGLTTLYFRHQTRLTVFIYIIGFMLFIDGIFYITGSRRIVESYQWFLKLENRSLRNYSLFLFLLALGLFSAGLY